MHTCFFCKNTVDMNVPTAFPYNDAYFPCPDCQKRMENKITLLSVTRKKTGYPEIADGLWPTGDYMLIPFTRKEKIFDPEMMPFVNRALRNNSLVAIEESIFKRTRIKYDTLKRKGEIE